ESEFQCHVKVGGVMFMKPLLLHASNRTTNGMKRRVIHIEFSKRELPGDLNWSECCNFQQECSTERMRDVNKKKIRGWKRRIKEIDRWFEIYKMPDLDRFKTREEAYVKIRISPWNLVCERVPPNWYFR